MGASGNGDEFFERAEAPVCLELNNRDAFLVLVDAISMPRTQLIEGWESKHTYSWFNVCAFSVNDEDR